MDFLESPELKTKYEKCKYIVKLWEHNFKKSKGRLPSKLDLREANKNVRDAYRKYYQLKTQALEQSFKDVDGFNSDEEDSVPPKSTDVPDQSIEPIPETEPVPEAESSETPKTSEKSGDNVWGQHLDKQVDSETKPKSAEKPNINQSYSKKLFCGSKFSKRNPRKSLSFTHRKSDISAETTTFASEPTNSFSEEQIEQSLSKSGLFNDSSIKIANVQEKISTQPTNIITSVLDNKYNRRLKTVDLGWLERTGATVEKPPQKQPTNLEDETNMCLDYDSDDIIDNSDEEISLNLGHIAKKPRLEINTKPVIPQQSEIPKLNIPKENVPITPICDKILEPLKTINTPAQTVVPTPKENTTKQLFELSDSTDSSKNTPIKKPAMKQKGKKTAAAKAPEKPKPLLRSNRSAQIRPTVEDSHSDEDPFRFENDSDEDPEYDPKATKSSKFQRMLLDDTPEEAKKKSPKRKPKEKTKKPKKTTGKVQEKEQVNEETQDATYELEYSIKPRVSAPRFKNIKKLIKIETSSKDKPEDSKEEPSTKVKDKRQQNLEKLQKKIESGSLNENFVTINLQKKVYVRGKKNTNFSKYKKQQWKNKKKALAGPEMDMGGCDGGMLTCFNCGQVGHFAQNCKATRGEDLLPLNAVQEEEPCPFPTLEEAAEMAQNSVLAIRKSNLAQTETEVIEEEPNDDDDIFDDSDNEALLAETLKLEEHVAKLDLKAYLDYVKVVEPYYKPQEDGSLIGTPKEVYEALQKFGHSQFRPGQEQTVMRILSGKSTLVTLSTGSGKSLCYQLPAYLYSQREPCISLVISPLVSLMEDQVTGIPSFLKAACLHTYQTPAQREKILEAISSGNLNVLLVSPEAIVAGEKSSGFGSLLRKLPLIAFACIDEAHCVSQWSHNFRPSYLMICRVLRERMGVKTVLGLTATATRSTRDSIINHLEITDGDKGVISDRPLPDNLTLSVSKDHQRDEALRQLLRSDRYKDLRSIIIYCTRREECNRISALLRTDFQFDPQPQTSTSKKRKRLNVQAEPYHAGLPASRRRTIQRAFMSGELRIVVATVAFGMGINKADIRSVIHYNMPRNFESYVQEIGRSGRDGLPAHCHLFLDSKGGDENELRRHIHANSIDHHVIRKLLEKIFLPCSCKGVCPKHEVAFSIEDTVRALDIPEENISTLLCYLELHENKYIELLSPAYTACKIISYGGPLQIRKAAKECPPLAMALALQKHSKDQENSIEFAIVDIAAAIGWDSGICKHKLKNLEWTAVNGQPKRSPLTVNFSNLGFRLLAPGNLSGDQLDEALDSLYEHVVKQEETSLLQLRAVHQTLIAVAERTYHACLNSDTAKGETLKAKIREYFDSPTPLAAVSLEDKKLVDTEQVIASIHGLIGTYRENNFTGRAIARIFHGIMSPNYPAVVWGRCKYWRAFINVDFHAIRQLATKEILNCR